MAGSERRVGTRPAPQGAKRNNVLAKAVWALPFMFESWNKEEDETLVLAFLGVLYPVVPLGIIPEFSLDWESILMDVHTDMRLWGAREEIRYCLTSYHSPPTMMMIGSEPMFSAVGSTAIS